MDQVSQLMQLPDNCINAIWKGCYENAQYVLSQTSKRFLKIFTLQYEKRARYHFYYPSERINPCLNKFITTGRWDQVRRYLRTYSRFSFDEFISEAFFKAILCNYYDIATLIYKKAKVTRRPLLFVSIIELGYGTNSYFMENISRCTPTMFFTDDTAIDYDTFYEMCEYILKYSKIQPSFMKRLLCYSNIYASDQIVCIIKLLKPPLPLISECYKKQGKIDVIEFVKQYYFHIPPDCAF